MQTRDSPYLRMAKITFRHSSGCRSFGYLTMVSCLGPSPTQHRNPGTARMLLLLCPQPETPHTSKLPRIQRSSLRHTAAPRGEVECLKQTWKRLTCVGYLPVPTCQPNIRIWCFSTVASSWLLAWHDNDSFCLDDYRVITSLKGWKVPVQIVAWQRFFFPANT